MTEAAHRELADGSGRLALGARLDRILAAGERTVALASDPRMDEGSRGLLREALEVTYQMFRDGLAFADAMDQGRLPLEWLQGGMPRDLADGPDVARYGALVRARLSGWFEGASPSEYSRTIETDRGLETGHELLERTMGQATRRLDRLRALIEDLHPRAHPRP